VITIEIRKDGKYVAGARVTPRGGDGHLVGYEVEAVEAPRREYGREGRYARIDLSGHRVSDSYWLLAERIASALRIGGHMTSAPPKQPEPAGRE